MALSESSFLLGDWLVEPSLNRIVREDSAVQLEPKVIDVLACLAARAGDVVSKREIIDAAWKTEFIADNTLTHAIAELRRALGDDARTPRYIETISKKGYRVVAPVKHLSSVQTDLRPKARTMLVEVDDRTLWLEAGDNIIGRAPGCLIRLGSPKVSRHHARILVESDRALLEDLGSKHGTHLNGQLIEGVHELHEGDEIRVGPASLVFRTLEGYASTEAES